MTWDLKGIQLQAYIHHFLHIILCDYKCLAYLSVFPPLKTKKIRMLRQIIETPSIFSLLIKRANTSWYNLEEDKTACEAGFC